MAIALAYRSNPGTAVALAPNSVGSPVIAPSAAGGMATSSDFQAWLLAMQAARKRDQVIYGRYTGPQLWHSQNVDLATAQTILVPKQLTLEKPHERLLAMFAFRITITGADFDTPFPEIPQNLMKSFRMWGSAGAFGAQTMWQISGASLFALPHVLGGNPGESYVTVKPVGAGAQQMRMAPPGLPFLPAIETSMGQLDVIVMFQVPTAPYMGNGTDARRQLSRYMLSPQDWGNTIQVEIGTGDRTSLGTPNGATVVAFSAYGSNTGQPQLSLFQNFALLGPDRAYTRKNGLVLRTERPLNQFTTQTQQTRLSVLDQKITANVVVKSGTGVTSTTGISSYSDLTNEQLNQTRVVHGTTPVRYNQSNESYLAYYGAQLNFQPGGGPGGYLPISFMEMQNIMNAYRGDALEGGANFEVQSDVAIAGAGNVQSIIQEEIIQPNNGGPFGAVVAI